MVFQLTGVRLFLIPPVSVLLNLSGDHAACAAAGTRTSALTNAVLDRFWIRDDSYIEAYGIEPNQAWFMKREERDGLMLSEISLDYHSNEPSANISFNRHRTRWLITDNQLGEIPIGMRERDIETGVK